MNIGQIRFVKRALFALLLGCSTYVGVYVWEGVQDRGSVSPDMLDEPENPTSRQVELEQLDSEGRTEWTLKAAESVGRTEASQLFRDVEIHFSAGDGETPLVVTADDCEIGRRNRVHLEGNVVVEDDSTLRLEANTLEYAQFPDRVWSNEPVRYSKKGLSGDAGAMHYVIKRGELDFTEGVRMTIQDKGEAPTRITSKIAHMRRNRHWVQFVDAVRVRQSGRRLHANDLQLFLDDANEELVRLVAYEKVDLRMRITEEDGGEDDDSNLALTSEPGVKRLLTRRLDMLFRPGGEILERARARGQSRLVMRLPEDAVEGYDKQLEGHLLAFDFDERGELTNLRGRGGVRLVLTPRDPNDDEEKIVTSRRLESTFDPETGDLVQATCLRTVEFEHGAVRATGDRGVFRPAQSLLVLTRSPRLWDTRASLEAEKIEINIDSGDVQGFANVRSTSSNELGATKLFPSAENEPVYFVADHLEYRRAGELAIYTGGARGFQGRSRVEADTIRIHQREGDLVAEGDVRTVFLQKLVEESSPEVTPKPTVTEAESLYYRAAQEVLEYREKVRMRSEDITMRGVSIDVFLGEGGGAVRELVAEGEVEIETVDGKAAGDHARYLPEEERMTVTGRRAWLENSGKLTEGKQLTFFLTDDTILVDGREQRRTKTTYTSKPRPF